MLLKLLVLVHLVGVTVIGVCVVGCLISDALARHADRIGALRDALSRGTQLQRGAVASTVLVLLASGIALTAMFYGG